MNPLDLRPDFRKMGPDTISTEADRAGDGGSSLCTVLAGALANVTVFKESFAIEIHDLVLWRIVVFTNQSARSKSQTPNYKQISNPNIQ